MRGAPGTGAIATGLGTFGAVAFALAKTGTVKAKEEENSL